MKEKQCHRKIVWHGKIEKITVDYHSFSWSGNLNK